MDPNIMIKSEYNDYSGNLSLDNSGDQKRRRYVLIFELYFDFKVYFNIILLCIHQYYAL